ncbi:hypothetical protein MOBT1_002372 [Malassezia obtusa]|uniref:LIM zinc-binding domain-containing protein n=1 Tax=Malassezia obtusa TaxID=76774 RepID=A0AAF0ITY4_9BASI|nr:hypothetical protein MOBT1_002372 [Malassezia obtusa]
MPPGASGPAARPRPLPTPLARIHASPSAYDVLCGSPSTPPPVPPKCAHDSPASLTKSESLRRRADELMDLGSPSRSRVRRGTPAPEKRPLPTPPAPLSDARRLENAPHAAPPPPPSPVRPTPHAPYDRTRDVARTPSPAHAAPSSSGAPPLPPRAPSPAHAPRPVPVRTPSPLRGTRPLPSTDGVFGPESPRPLVPTRPEPRRASPRSSTPPRAPPRPDSPRKAPPRVPPRAAAAPPPSTPPPHAFLRRPSPAALAEPPRPETPTRSRTPEGGVPRIARTPSPVRSARPYQMTPAIPGGPPVPLILVEGEELTDALMDPGAASDATVSFDDLPKAPAQHASRAAAGDAAGDVSSDSLVTSDTRVVCRGCGRGIAGSLVRAMDAAWHVRCFVCAHCATPLEHVSFYEHAGRPYCHLDYHELFARRCFYCETPIVDERFVTIDDARLGQRSYHELHFFCAGCGEPFLEAHDAPSPREDMDETAYAGRPFFVQGAHPYCEGCHTRLHKPRCQACRAPIERDAVRALRAEWHPECFVCTRCRAPLHDAPVFRGPDGAPCDAGCYEAWMRRAN